MVVLTQKRYIRESLAVINCREWASQYDLKPKAEKAGLLTQTMTTLSLEAEGRSQSLQEIVNAAVESFWMGEESGKADKALQIINKMLTSLERQRDGIARVLDKTAYHLRLEDSEEWTVFCELRSLVLHLVESETREAEIQKEYLEGHYTNQIGGEKVKSG